MGSANGCWVISSRRFTESSDYSLYYLILTTPQGKFYFHYQFTDGKLRHTQVSLCSYEAVSLGVLILFASTPKAERVLSFVTAGAHRTQ